MQPASHPSRRGIRVNALKGLSWKSLVGGVLLLGMGAALGSSVWRPAEASSAPTEKSTSTSPDLLEVEVIHPHPGGVARETTQPGSVQAYRSAELFAKVSGYLDELAVDIGSRVSKGQ